MPQKPHNEIQREAIAGLPCVDAFELFDETGSTQDHARQAALHESHPLPALFAAYLQTQGRGRGANQWWAGEGSLTFSWLIDPAVYPLHGALIPAAAVATGAAICDALNEMANLTDDNACRLKWPNDVYLGGRKLGGVLMETIVTSNAATQPASRLRMIAGIGLNINNTLQAAPEDIARLAVSLSDTAGCYFDMTDVLLSLLPAIDQALQKLAAGDAQQVEHWQELSVLNGREVTVRTGAASDTISRTGACTGIASDGALLLQSDSGLRRIISGMVTGIRPSL